MTMVVCGGPYLDDQIERVFDDQIINPHIANAKKGSKATLICEINNRRQTLSRQQFGRKILGYNKYGKAEGKLVVRKALPDLKIQVYTLKLKNVTHTEIWTDAPV